MTSLRIALGAVAVVFALTACGGGSSSDSSGDSQSDSATSDSSGSSSDSGADSGVASLGVPLAADLLGPGFEGLYVSSAVRVESLSTDPPTVSLIGVPCDQLVFQLVSSDWEIVDRLKASPTLIAGGIKPIVVLRDGDRVAYLVYNGEGDCSARLIRAESTDLTLRLPSGDVSGQGWVVTTRCSRLDGDGVGVSVEMLAGSGDVVSFEVRLYGSEAQFDGGIAGNAPGGFYGELGRLYADQFAQPTGTFFQIDSGTGTHTAQSDTRGTVDIQGTVTTLDGSSGQIALAFPYSCATYDDVAFDDPLGG